MLNNQNSNENNQSSLGGFPPNNTPQTPEEVKPTPSKPEINQEIKRSDLPEKS